MGYLVVLLLAIALGLFALANPQAVPVMLWPRGWIAEVPLWQAILLPAALGFLAGALIVWAAHVPHRRRLTRVENAARLMEADISLRDAPAAKPR